MDSRYGRTGEGMELLLFVAGEAPNSLQARANLEAILAACSPEGACRLKIVDVLEEPLEALEQGVLVTPTLVRLSPSPVRILGNLSDRERVATLLGLPPRPIASASER